MDINNLILLLVALMNAFTAFMAYRTHQNVLVVELATNSMKDALVAATGSAAHAAGVTEGRAQAKADRAMFNAGVKSERDTEK